jgi:hypothetical protein
MISNVSQSYSDEKIMIISIHNSKTDNSNKLDKNCMNISWSKVNSNNISLLKTHMKIFYIYYAYLL